MTITIFLEIAIGMVMIWATLALAVMGFQEFLAGIFEWRAKGLEKAIRGMLEDPEKQAGAKSIVDEIYKHPLMQSLSEPAKPGDERRKPSYIPDRLFALALFDILMTAGTTESVIQAGIKTLGNHLEELKTTGKIPPQALKDIGEAGSKLYELAKAASKKSEVFAQLNIEIMRVRDELTAKYPDLGPVLDELPRYLGSQQIIEGITSLAGHNPTIAKALSSLMTEATRFAAQGGPTLAAFRTNIETWFNDTMDRLSGWYKRKMQVITFIIGIIFAITLNVDSITIATTLWREPTVRAALVSQARTLEEQLSETEGDYEATIAAFNRQLEENVALPIGWTWVTPDQEQECTLAPKTWNCVCEIPNGAKCLVPVESPQDIPVWGGLASKLVGWIISGAAAAMGAPFWFDVLKKLVNIRSAGKNPAEELEQRKSGTKTSK